MPGLLRAERRLGPRERRDQGGARRRRVGDHRAEGLDVARAPRGLVLRRRADRPGGAASTRDCRTCSCRCTRTASRSARSCRSPGRRSSTRSSSTAPARRPRTSSASLATAGAVAMATLGFERGVATLGQQIGFARRARPASSTLRGVPVPIDDPIIADRLTQSWIELKVMRYTALRMLAVETPGRRGVDLQAALGAVAPAARRARDGGAWRGRALRPTPKPETTTSCSGCSCSVAPDTIYGGSNEIQRDILARRMLGLSARVAECGDPVAVLSVVRRGSRWE